MSDDDANAGTTPGGAPRLTLDTAVRRLRTDEAFFIRISKAIRQNEAALERLSR